MMRSVLSSVLVIGALAGTAQAGVRVVHASPDAPNVDVYVNNAPGMGMPAISNLAFTAATGYVPLPTASYRFRVTPTGFTSPVVIDADNVPIQGNQDYSVVAINFLSSISPLLLNDDNTINPSQARVRFVHAAPDVPTVDVFAEGLATPLFDAVTFGNSGGYVSVDPGSYNLQVRLDSNGAAALDVPGVQLQAGNVYTIFAMGALSSNSVQAVAIRDIPAPGAAALLPLAGLAAFRRRR
jgi:hypothetical protein